MLSDARKREIEEFPLSYTRVGTIFGTQDHIPYSGYKAFWMSIPPEIRGFIFLRKDSVNRFQSSSPEPEMLKHKSRGYKMHISIHDADDASSNLMHAWDIFVRILLRHEIYQVKIVAPSFRDALRRDEDQRGKEITIYCFKEMRPPHTRRMAGIL